MLEPVGAWSGTGGSRVDGVAAVVAETLVGTACQGTQHLTLVPVEAVHWALAHRTVPTHVGRALQPARRLLVEVLVVGERTPVEKLSRM